MELAEEITRELIAKQNLQLDELIKESLIKKGYDVSDIFHLEKLAKEKCNVTIQGKIHTLFAEGKPVCQWSYEDSPLKFNMDKGDYNISVDTYFKFNYIE